MGAAGGGEDVLKAVEKLKEIMYFDVLQLLGQGCNGAVFKVGCACACVRVFRFCPAWLPPTVCSRAHCVRCVLLTWLLGYLLAYLLSFFIIPGVSRQKWCTRPWPTACSLR